MIIVHTPADGEVERFDFRSVRTSEASIITRLMSDDVSWPQVKARVNDNDPDALRAVAFVIKKRSNPSLRIDDFDPVADELASKMDHRDVDVWAQIAAEKLAPFNGSAEAARLALNVVLDEADDVDYAQATIERLLAGKFPAALGETNDSHESSTGESISSEPSTSASSPTSSTSTEPDSTS